MRHYQRPNMGLPLFWRLEQHPPLLNQWCLPRHWTTHDSWGLIGCQWPPCVTGTEVYIETLLASGCRVCRKPQERPGQNSVSLNLTPRRIVRSRLPWRTSPKHRLRILKSTIRLVQRLLWELCQLCLELKLYVLHFRKNKLGRTYTEVYNCIEDWSPQKSLVVAEILTSSSCWGESKLNTGENLLIIE